MFFCSKLIKKSQSFIASLTYHLSLLLITTSVSSGCLKRKDYIMTDERMLKLERNL